MKFKLEIDLEVTGDGPGGKENLCAAISNTLMDIEGRQTVVHGSSASVFDAKGNTAGHWKVTL